MTTEAGGADIRVVVVDHDPAWGSRFRVEGRLLRDAFGPMALRIDHIGSTAVPGLAAKDVLDVQVTVAEPADLDEPSHAVRRALAALGFDHASDNDDRRKRFFSRRREGKPWVNLHVRRHGCVSQQQSLLLRDYLRAVPAARQRYEHVKRVLAQRMWPSVDAYAEAKGDVVWALLRDADAWSWTGWRPGPCDA